MRILLKLSPNNKAVPFEYQQVLTGALHKWLGNNKEHGELSLYSFSNLFGGKARNNCLHFSGGATLAISAWNIELIQKISNGILQEPELAWGMRVNEIQLQETPDFLTQELFYVASPILIKRRFDEKIHHVVYTDQKAGWYLKESLEKKLAAANIEHKEFSIEFDTSYPRAQTKLIAYKTIRNKTSLCPVLIKGDVLVKQFAWNVGLGNSTGIGFGALK